MGYRRRIDSFNEDSSSDDELPEENKPELDMSLWKLPECLNQLQGPVNNNMRHQWPPSQGPQHGREDQEGNNEYEDPPEQLRTRNLLPKFSGLHPSQAEQSPFSENALPQMRNYPSQHNISRPTNLSQNLPNKTSNESLRKAYEGKIRAPYASTQMFSPTAENFQISSNISLSPNEISQQKNSAKSHFLSQDIKPHSNLNNYKGTSQNIKTNVAQPFGIPHHHSGPGRSTEQPITKFSTPPGISGSQEPLLSKYPTNRKPNDSFFKIKSNPMDLSQNKPQQNFPSATLALEDGPIIPVLPVYRELFTTEYFHALGAKKSTVAKYLSEGMFLLRPSSRHTEESPLTLCLIYLDTSFSLAINRRSNGRYAIGKEKDGEQTFISIRDLVEFYQEYPIKTEEGIDIYLQVPAPKK